MQPELSDIVYVHSMINNAHSSQIQKLILSFNKKMLKQILLIYIQFFFSSSNRDKYFNTNDSNILNLATNKVTKKKYKPKPYVYKPTSISTFLLSTCISYLTHKDRANIARINLKWLKASCTNTARYHVQITYPFINKEMIKSPDKFKYNYVGFLETNKNINIKCRKGKTLTTNYYKNLIKIISSPTLKTFKGEIHNNLLPFFNKNMQTINKVIIENEECIFPTKNIILSCEKVVANNEYKYLWMNDKKSKIFSIFYETQDMNKYILSETESKLQYLDLSQMNVNKFSLNDSKMVMCHPIYLLWNISSLKICKLNMTLPISVQFETDMSQLLASNIVNQKCKKQYNFKQLFIGIVVNDIDNEWNISMNRQTKHNQYFNRDYGVFLKYVLQMYTHLTSFTCKFIRFYEFQRNIFNKNIKRINTLDLTFMSFFHNLRQINLDLVTINDAKTFLLHMENNTKIQSLCLNIIMVTDLDNSECEYGFVQHSINEFVDNICNYFEKHYQHLHSFIINIDNKYAIHSNLQSTFWCGYNKYLACIVDMIKNNCIYDGYLQFNIPNAVGKILEKRSRPDKREKSGYIYKDYKWNKINMNESLKIEKLLCLIQTMMHDYNSKLDEMNWNEKKIVLHLPGLILHKTHSHFLKFWFYNDNELYNNCKFVMC